jgi:TPR repeat protein
MGHGAGGWCFGSGTGVAKCAEQAEHWYRLAYEAGSQHGLLRYALYLEWRDESAKAQKVYETGWDLGLTPAVFRLTQARLKPSTMTLAERLAWKPGLEWAAAAGHPGARFLLAKYLFRGVFGIRGIPLGLKLTWGLFAAILRGDENRAIGV